MRNHHRNIALVSCLCLFGCAGGNNHSSSTKNITDAGTPSPEASRPNYYPEGGDLPDGPIEAGSYDLGYTNIDNATMEYQGGQVLVDPINVYIIYYGNWANTNTPSILEYLISNFDISSLYGIDTGYYEQASVIGMLDDAGLTTVGEDGGYPDAATTTQFFVSNKVNLAQTTYNAYTHNISLDDWDIQAVITDTIADGTFPADPDGVYFVFTSTDVNVSSEGAEWCVDFCGFHNINYLTGFTLRYAFVGDTAKCPDGCSLQQEYNQKGIQNSPNQNWSADGMSSIVIHELSEMATDPDPFNHIAWMATDGSEMGDLCAWTYGQPYYTANGSVANVKVGEKDYMLQQLWSIDLVDGGGCALAK